MPQRSESWNPPPNGGRFWALSRSGVWRGCTMRGRRGNSIKVHWDSFRDKYDEWIDASKEPHRVVKQSSSQPAESIPPTKGGKSTRSSSAPSASNPGVSDPGCLDSYPAGSSVYALSHTGTWRECTVVARVYRPQSRIKISWNGFSVKHDEWIDLSKDAKRVSKDAPAEMPWFIHQDPRELFIFEKKLGQGAFGEVTLVTRKLDELTRAYQTEAGQKFAAKQIETSTLRGAAQIDSFKNEVSLQLRLDHPNICRLYEVYSTPKFMYMITELVSGGDLFGSIDRAPSNLLCEEFGKRSTLCDHPLPAVTVMLP